MDGNDEQAINNSDESKLGLDIEDRLDNLGKKLYNAYNGIYQKNNRQELSNFTASSSILKADSDFKFLLKEVESQWQSVLSEKESEREYLNEQSELLDQREHDLDQARTAFEESKMTFEEEKIEFFSIINSEWEIIKQEKEKFFHWRDRIINEILDKQKEMKDYVTFLSSEKDFLEEKIAKSRNELKGLKRKYDSEILKLKDNTLHSTVEVQPAMLYLAETNNELLTIQKMLLQLRRDLKLNLKDNSPESTESDWINAEQLLMQEQPPEELIRKEITNELTQMFEESRGELEKEWERLRSEQEKFEKEKEQFLELKAEFDNSTELKKYGPKKIHDSPKNQKLEHIIESLKPTRDPIRTEHPVDHESIEEVSVPPPETEEKSTSIFDSLQKSAMETELQKVLQSEELAQIWDYLQTDLTEIESPEDNNDPGVQKE